MRLSIPRDLNVMGAEKFRLNTSNQRGMNPKKRHEVSQMTRLVNDVCQDSGCNRIVDVGAGLVSNSLVDILEKVEVNYIRSFFLFSC